MLTKVQMMKWQIQKCIMKLDRPWKVIILNMMNHLIIKQALCLEVVVCELMKQETLIHQFDPWVTMGICRTSVNHLLRLLLSEARCPHPYQ